MAGLELVARSATQSCSAALRVKYAAVDRDGETEATERARAALVAHGYPHRVLRVGVTDMRHIKVRRKGRGR
jgi:hypothetical protein